MNQEEEQKVRPLFRAAAFEGSEYIVSHYRKDTDKDWQDVPIGSTMSRKDAEAIVEWCNYNIPPLLHQAEHRGYERGVKEMAEQGAKDAHNHYLGCSLEDGKWHYSYDNEVVNLLDETLSRLTEQNPTSLNTEEGE